MIRLQARSESSQREAAALEDALSAASGELFGGERVASGRPFKQVLSIIRGELAIDDWHGLDAFKSTRLR